MAGIQRTLAYLKARITASQSHVLPQDMLDMLVSLQMAHGQIWQRHNAQETTISDTTNFFECAFSATALSNAHYFDMPANGRLRYTGPDDRVLHIACSFAYTGTAANQAVEWRLGKNGTPSQENEIDSFISIPSDVQTSAMHWITQVSTNDYISMFAHNEDGADNVLVSHVNLQAVGMIV